MNFGSRKVKVRKLNINDMPKFMLWGNHTDIRFRHYNFPKCNNEELIHWYKSKNKFLRKKIYISENEEGKILGYITIKHINWFIRKAEMGIVFDPNILGQGYGSQSIIEIFDIYFNEMKMRTLFLKVADFNKRAEKCYEKVGFKKVGSSLEAFEEQDCSFELLLKTKDFYMDGEVLKTRFNYMEITKKDYNFKKIKSNVHN